MGNVVVGLSMSLDGFIAGPNDGRGNPLGDGGARLFDWLFAGTESVGPDDFFKPYARSRSVVEEMFECGAIITGRRTFDIANGWGGHHTLGAPFFLLTHDPPDEHAAPRRVKRRRSAEAPSAARTRASPRPGSRRCP